MFVNLFGVTGNERDGEERRDRGREREREL